MQHSSRILAYGIAYVMGAATQQLYLAMLQGFCITACSK